MTIKSNILMITAAVFISGAAVAQDLPDVGFLNDLFSGTEAPTEQAVADALAANGYTVERLRIDDDGEVTLRFSNAEGVVYRYRLDGDETRFGLSDDGIDSDEDNGEDSSDSSSEGSDSSDSNDDSSGNSSDGNDDSSGGSDD